MIVMHGLFDLADDCGEQEFAAAFRHFVQYLKTQELAVAARFLRRQAHAGYNADAPETEFCVSVDFADLDMAERCWQRIEQNEEPLKSRHAAVFSKVRRSRFFLSEQVGAE